MEDRRIPPALLDPPLVDEELLEEGDGIAQVEPDEEGDETRTRAPLARPQISAEKEQVTIYLPRIDDQWVIDSMRAYRNGNWDWKRIGNAYTPQYSQTEVFSTAGELQIDADNYPTFRSEILTSAWLLVVPDDEEYQAYFRPATDSQRVLKFDTEGHFWYIDVNTDQISVEDPNASNSTSRSSQVFDEIDLYRRPASYRTQDRTFAQAYAVNMGGYYAQRDILDAVPSGMPATIDFSNFLGYPKRDSISTERADLERALTGILSKGLLYGALQKDLGALTATFRDAETAIRVLDRICYRQEFLPDGFLDGETGSMVLMTTGYNTGKKSDDSMMMASTGWGIGDSVTLRDLAHHDALAKYGDNTLYFPFLKKGEKIFPYMQDPTYYQNQTLVKAGSFVMPAGCTIPSQDEVLEYLRSLPKNGLTTEIPQEAGSHFAYLDLILQERHYDLTLINDPNMIVTTQNGMTYVAFSPFFQPVRKSELYRYHDLEGWYSYEEAYAMAVLVNQASDDLGIELSMRRLADEGFRDFEEDGVTIKKARYCILYDEETVNGAIEGLKAVIKLAKDNDEDVVRLPHPDLDDLVLSIDQARSLIAALESAEDGNEDAIQQWRDVQPPAVKASLDAQDAAQKAQSTSLKIGIGGLLATIGFIWFINRSTKRQLAVAQEGLQLQRDFQAQMKKDMTEGMTVETAEEIVDQFAPDKVEEYAANYANGDYHRPSGMYAPPFFGRVDELLAILQHYAGIIAAQEAGTNVEGGIRLTGLPGSGKSEMPNLIAYVMATGRLPPLAADYEHGFTDAQLATWLEGRLLSDVAPELYAQFFDADGTTKVEMRQANMSAFMTNAQWKGKEEGNLNAAEVYSQNNLYTLWASDEIADAATAGATQNDPTSTLQKLKTAVSQKMKMMASCTIADLNTFLTAGGRITDDQMSGRFVSIHRNGEGTEGFGNPPMGDTMLIMHSYVLNTIQTFSGTVGLDSSALNLSFRELFAHYDPLTDTMTHDLQAGETRRDNLFSYIVRRAEANRGTANPRKSRALMIAYITDCQRRVRGGETVVMGEHDFDLFYQRNPSPTLVGLEGQIRELINNILYNDLVMLSETVDALAPDLQDALAQYLSLQPGETQAFCAQRYRRMLAVLRSIRNSYRDPATGETGVFMGDLDALPLQIEAIIRDPATAFAELQAARQQAAAPDGTAPPSDAADLDLDDDIADDPYTQVSSDLETLHFPEQVFSSPNPLIALMQYLSGQRPVSDEPVHLRCFYELHALAQFMGGHENFEQLVTYILNTRPGEHTESTYDMVNHAINDGEFQIDPSERHTILDHARRADCSVQANLTDRKLVAAIPQQHDIYTQALVAAYFRIGRENPAQQLTRLQELDAAIDALIARGLDGAEFREALLTTLEANILTSADPVSAQVTLQQNPMLATFISNRDAVDTSASADTDLVTNLSPVFAAFDPTQNVGDTMAAVDSFCLANSVDGGQLGDFILIQRNRQHTRLSVQYPTLSFHHQDVLTIITMQVTYRLMQDTGFQAISGNPTQARAALTTAIAERIAAYNTEHQINIVETRAGANITVAQQQYGDFLNSLANAALDNGMHTQTQRTRTRAGH